MHRVVIARAPRRLATRPQQHNSCHSGTRKRHILGLNERVQDQTRYVPEIARRALGAAMKPSQESLPIRRCIRIHPQRLGSTSRTRQYGDRTRTSVARQVAGKRQAAQSIRIRSSNLRHTIVHIDARATTSRVVLNAGRQGEEVEPLRSSDLHLAAHGAPLTPRSGTSFDAERRFARRQQCCRLDAQGIS